MLLSVTLLKAAVRNALGINHLVAAMRFSGSGFSIDNLIANQHYKIGKWAKKGSAALK